MAGTGRGPGIQATRARCCCCWMPWQGGTALVLRAMAWVPGAWLVWERVGFVSHPAQRGRGERAGHWWLAGFQTTVVAGML